MFVHVQLPRGAMALRIGARAVGGGWELGRDSDLVASAERRASGDIIRPGARGASASAEPRG